MRRWVGILCAVLAAGAAGAGPLTERLREAAAPWEARAATGILYDRVLPMSRLAAHDGSPASAPASLAAWRQIYDEMWRASLAKPAWPGLESLRQEGRRGRDRGVVPLAGLHLRYDRIDPESRDVQQARVFAFAALHDRTYRGAEVVFDIDPRRFVTNSLPLRHLDIDFDDGMGFRRMPARGTVAVRYATTGRKSVRVRGTQGDGTVLWAGFPFDVRALGTPSPHDTLHITAAIPYAGAAGSGRGYVYLAPGHAAIERPIVVVEGFDIDDSLGWDELYALLNQENLLESLRADGFDAVVLDFTSATDYLQRNAFVVAELVSQVEARIAPRTGIVLIGASMGGLVSRYALAHLESQGTPHRVRTFISFDAPQTGANIPLGVQYWLDFFKEQSADAAFLLGRLDTPAARQMLVYHHTEPPAAGSDPLRAAWLADLAAAGDYPAAPRLVAVANGSGSGQTQGFAPGEQIVSYVYDTLFIDIVGNVWAVADGPVRDIFDGLIRIFFVTTGDRTVQVGGTLPYDNAPGGSRASMADMDATQAPYGDIVALHPSHCFIPTVSALGLETQDLFYDIDGDPNLSPFDAVYFPATNQPHVTITPENAAWLRGEILAPVDATADVAPPRARLFANAPNPFNPATAIHFELPAPARVRLGIHDVRGTRLRLLLDGPAPAGATRCDWDGRDADGRHLGAGVYLYRLETPFGVLSRKMTLLP